MCTPVRYYTITFLLPFIMSVRSACASICTSANPFFFFENEIKYQKKKKIIVFGKFDVLS